MENQDARKLSPSGTAIHYSARPLSAFSEFTNH